jgi:hypothetical protein
MADRYWVGGTGTWNTTNTTNWSATNGGSGGASVPVAADNVFFTSSSGGGTCTNSGTNNCLSLNMTGYTGTFAGTGIINISGNLTLSASGSLTYTGSFDMAGSAVTSTVNTNGKTIPGNLRSNKTNNVVRMDSAATVSGQVSINSAGFNLNGFTVTTTYFNYSTSATSLQWGSPAGKVVCSRSTTGLTLNCTGAGIATGGRIEVLSPPAAITAQVQGQDITNVTSVDNFPDVYLINSGTGTIDVTNAFRILEVGSGSYSVSNTPYIRRSMTVDPSYTGTFSGGIILEAIDTGGTDLNPNGKTFGGDFTVLTRPITSLGLAPIRVNQSATFTGTSQGFRYFGGTFSITNNSTLTVNNFSVDPRPTANNSSINFPGTSKIRCTGTTGNVVNILSVYYTRCTAILNNNPIEVVAPSSGNTINVRLPQGEDPTTGRTECFSIRIVAGGTGSVSFSHPEVSSGPINLKDLIAENGAYTLTLSGVTEFYISRNLTYGGTLIANLVTSYWFNSDNATVQEVNLNGAGGFSMYLVNNVNGPVRLTSNAGSTGQGTHLPNQIGQLYFGNPNFGTGAGWIELQSFSLMTRSGLQAAGVTNAANINFGTGKIICYSESVSAVSFTWYSDVYAGTISGSRNVELLPFGNLADNYNRDLQLNSVPVAGKEINVRCVNTGSTGRLLLSLIQGTLTLESGVYTYGIGSSSTEMYGNINLLGSILFDASFQFNAPSAAFTSTITSNGFTFSALFNLNGSGHTTTLADAMICRQINLTQGTLNLNNRSLTITSSLSASGNGVRTLAFGTGSITINQNASFSIFNSTNLTMTGTSRQIFATVGASGCTITTDSSLASTNAIDITTLVVGSGGTVTTGGVVRNLTLNGGTYTFTRDSDYYIYGDLTMNGAVTTFSGGTSSLRFQAASGTQIISTNGNTFGGTGGVVMNTSGVTYQLNSNSTFASGLSFSNGTLNLNNFRLQVSSFDAPSGTVNFQSSGAIRLTGGGVVWNTSSGGGVIASGTNRFVEPNLNSNQTLTFGTLIEANTFDVNVPTTASNNTLTISTGNSVRSLTFANVAYTVANTALNIYGNVTVLGTTPVFTAGTNTWTFLASSGTQTITSGGETFDFPMTCNVTGTLALGDNVTIGSSRSFTHTAGTVSLGTRTLSTGFYATSNSNARTISFGTGGQISLTGNGTVWDSSTNTNLTSTGTNKTIAPQLNAVQSLNFGAISEANAFDISVPATAGNFTLSTTNPADRVRNLTFANAIYTVSFSQITIFGSFTVAGTSPTFTSTSNVITFGATSGSHSITTNGEVLDFPININAPGATYSLGSALTLGSTRTLTLTQGTFNTSNFNVTSLSLSSSGSSARTLTLGSSTWTILGSGATAWDVTTSTNMTLNRGTSRISMSSASSKTFNGGGLTYGILEQAGAGALTITGTSNRFADIQRSFAGANTITLPGGVTTFFDDFTLTGLSAVARTTFNSSGTMTISKSSGTVSVDFLSIANSTATGGAAWYAGNNSVNLGGNTGWIFTAPPQASGNMLMVFM